MAHAVEFGLDTFGDVTLAADGQPLPHAQVLRHVVEEGVLRPVALRGAVRRQGASLRRTAQGATGHLDGAHAIGADPPVGVPVGRGGTVRSLGLSRFDLKYSCGTLPHANLMASIELYGTRVVPLVRDMLA